MLCGSTRTEQTIVVVIVVAVAVKAAVAGVEVAAAVLAVAALTSEIIATAAGTKKHLQCKR